MKMKLTSFSLAALLTTGGLSVNAANIVWVSWHSGDNTPSDQSGAGLTQATDIAYTSLLAANGYTVTRYVTTSTPDTSFLNSFDLVILGRSAPSGDYYVSGDGGAQAGLWNGLTAPLINMNSSTVQGNRMGWFTGTSGAGRVSIGTVDMTVLNTSHPIFSGVTLGGAGLNTAFGYVTNTVVAPWNNALQRTLQAGPNVALAGGGVLLATVGTAGDSQLGRSLIAEWQAGATMNNGNMLGGHRLMFFSGSSELSGQTSDQAGLYDLSADGGSMFLNAVDYMLIPEPGSVTLLGLGALALLWRPRSR